MLETFKAFMADDNAWDMYVTGAAGTGKTTDMATMVQHCMDNEIPALVSAFTHKACGILRSKLPEGAKVTTLHSFLSKRPTINQHATNSKQIQQNRRVGKAEIVRVLFVDEYSMVGEQDLMDLRAAQDEDYDGHPELKVVWIGDPNQLPPVGDMQSVRPSGKYQVKLTKIYRQAMTNPLMQPLQQLVSFINGEPAEPLATSSKFVRGQDIVKAYQEAGDDKVLLAYTNARVQQLNASVQGYTEPKVGDKLFSPCTREFYTFDGWFEGPVSRIDRSFGGPLELGTKYKTLEHLLTLPDIRYAKVEDAEGNALLFATTFGHSDYRLRDSALKTEAANSNAAIEREHPGFKAAGWAKANAKKPLARRRAKAWRDFLTYDECVVCLDFAHAMTVHKSQGSTYDTVVVDTEDLAKVLERDYTLYLKLMYVAISRASNQVITN